MKKSVLLWILMVTLVWSLAGCASGTGGGNASAGNEAASAGGGSESSGGDAQAEKKEAEPPVELLNVSYDPTRELYEKFNAAFA